jgi:hypothetical protein
MLLLPTQTQPNSPQRPLDSTVVGPPTSNKSQFRFGVYDLEFASLISYRTVDATQAQLLGRRAPANQHAALRPSGRALAISRVALLAFINQPSSFS